MSFVSCERSRRAPKTSLKRFRSLALSLRQVFEPTCQTAIPAEPAYEDAGGSYFYSTRVARVADAWILEYTGAFVGPGDIGEEHTWIARAAGLPEGQRYALQLQRIDVGGRGVPTLRIHARLPPRQAAALQRAWDELAT